MRARSSPRAREPRAARAHGSRAPTTPRAFAAYVCATARAARPTHRGYLVVRNDDDALVGVFNFSEIVHGVFQSAYLGYYAFAPPPAGAT